MVGIYVSYAICSVIDGMLIHNLQDNHRFIKKLNYLAITV